MKAAEIKDMVFSNGIEDALEALHDSGMTYKQSEAAITRAIGKRRALAMLDAAEQDSMRHEFQSMLDALEL